MSRIIPVKDTTSKNAIQILQEQVSGRSGPTYVGTKWRFRAARWPTNLDLECIIFDHHGPNGWAPVAVLGPDGIWKGAE